MANLNPIDIFIPEIRQLVADKNLGELQGLLREINPIDLADGFSRLPPEQWMLILRLLPASKLMSVFEELDNDKQEYVLEHLDDQHLLPLVDGVAPQLVAKMLTRLAPNTVKKMSNYLQRGKRENIPQLTECSPECAGALMRTTYLPLRPEMTARRALEQLQAILRVRDETTADTLYVTDTHGHLLGELSLRSLIASPPDLRIRDLMNPAALIKIPATMDQEEAAKLFSKYKLLSAPVVDAENRLVGLLSASDMIKVLQQEATEDIQKLGAVETLDEPYFKVAFSRMIQKRATWLCALFVGETITAAAMGFFEKEIEKAVVLALFIPLIISSGGNSGSQAATLIVRALALKEVTFTDWLRVMRRELLSGLSLGAILGVIGFGVVITRATLFHIYGPHPILLATTVGISLVLIVMWGTLTGSLLPIFLRRMGLDPATASAPFVATLVDVTGLVIYFGTALLLLRGTLL
jgi:magnesium transporter